MMNLLWNEIAGRAGVVLSEEQQGKLSRYLDLLIEANARMNLTRIVDRAAAEVGHVADGLTLLPFLPAGEIWVADVGSGGGVPGLVLAVARPEARVTLIEATKKKAAFLKETAAALELANVEVLDWRVEDVGQSPEYREKFNVAAARAVATIDWLAEWCLPLAKRGGKVVLMKGPRHVEELAVAEKPIRSLGGGVAQVHGVELPGTENRVVVEIPKVRLTDRRYPRSASSAKGNPVRG